MKTIKGDLILNKDTIFKESITVKGDIKGYYNLKVEGDIIALNITAWDIIARDIIARDIIAMDITALDINALDIDAMDITAWNINARNIICEERIKKTKKAKTIARIFIQDRSQIKRKEWK